MEGALVFVVSLGVMFMYQGPPFPWWALVLIFFAPDLSFFGYLIGNRAGAFAYNLVHNYGLGLAITFLGASGDSAKVFAIGVLIAGHAGFDRMLGYGLKMPTGFHDTHLGNLKK